MNPARKTLGFAQFILVIFVLTLSAHAAGEVDTSFLANLSGQASGRVNKILIQPDGKALVGGSFQVAGGYARSGLFRLNSDGTIDTGFQPPSFFNSSGSVIISTIALLSNGKILVGGNFEGAGGTARQGIMRLSTDGSIDQTFTSPLNIGGTVLDLTVLPDDRILIAGNFTINDSGGNRVGIARLNSNGSFDSIVYQNIVAVFKLVLLPDGKLLTGNANSVRRFNIDGTFDPSFGSVMLDGSVQDMQLLADGKILIAGGFSQVNGANLRGLFRLNPDGTVDTTFNPGSSNPNFFTVYGITPTPAGKFLIFGGFSTYNGVARKSAALIDQDGALDTSFNYTAHNFGSIFDTAFLPDGRILVGGLSTASSSIQQNALARIRADGLPDTGFNVQIGNVGTAYKVLVQPDGKILVGGQFSFANGVPRVNLARFNQDGSLDTAFTPPGFNTSGGIYDIELQPDGKIIVPIWLGSSGSTYRLNPNGTTDIVISNTPYSYDAQYLPDGKFLVVNGDRVKRYNSNGTIDGTFTSLGTLDSFTIYKMALQPDGKIIIVGTFTQVSGINRGRIARLNADGTVDGTFNPPGGANANINAVTIQPDGKILIGGDFTGVNSDSTKKYLARLNADGSLDTSFSPVLNAPTLGLKLQADGKILIGGAMSTVNGASRAGIARVNQDGSLDTSFNVGSGTNSTVWSIDLQNDKIVYAGQFSATNGFSTLGVGRLLNAAIPQAKLFDYDGDGRADVSVFRASENRWYVFRSSDSVVAQQVFAIAGDVPVPADYDGDHKTDYAIYRPSNGAWWYLSSINNAQVTAQWGGEAGDVPRPGDFDGDGKSDFIIFRPANNFWYRISSVTGNTSFVQFGLAGDKPVIGDFDGDGKVDPAIFRPSTGDWWYQSSINNAQLAVRWGLSTDIPAPADYDGDGKTDFCVYRPSTGVWYIINSSNGSFTITQFGIAEDKPVPADYDGDGRADIAVFRPSTGIWYQLRSTNGFSAQQFGISTDVPTENAFVP
ncbi:MAG TPA: FG-GAP-like repeat-containing protein [Pyrinomonadaceae bacterium]|jgi:uncharacterized delta-60 repeat protein